MKAKLLILSIAVLCLSAAPAMAATFGDGGVGLQGVLDGITLLPNPSDSSVNVLTDEVPDSLDSHWHIGGTSASTNTMIIELATFAPGNVFGVYDITNNGATRIPIFTGPNVYGDQAFLSIDSAGNVSINGAFKGTLGDTWFGYYLDSSKNADGSNNPNGGIFYSDSTLNSDNIPSTTYDHMYAYQGLGVDIVQIPRADQPDGTPTPPWAPGLWTPGEYVLAWEDLKATAPSDWDYTDMVVMVQSVYVPVPGAVLLGILGLGVAGLKLRKYA